MRELLTFYHSHSSFIYPMGKKHLTTGIYYFVIRNNYRRKDICFGGQLHGVSRNMRVSRKQIASHKILVEIYLV